MLSEPSIRSKLILGFVFIYLASFVNAQHEEEHVVDTTSGRFWGQIVVIFFLVCLSGVVAGLTLGLMSLDTTNLSILQIAGTPQQQYYASRIIPIRKNGHILLATLLLTNTVLNETLPILFDGIFSKGFMSVIVSTALLVLFAEIIPQAVFSKHGLAIGAMFAFPVRLLIALWFIISWPISKFLDYLLGTHTGFTYGVAEFSALAGLHDNSKFPEGTLKHETVNAIQNILDMQEKQVGQIVTRTSNMVMLPSDTVLDTSKVAQYISGGYSHVFVYKHAGKEAKSGTIQDDFQIIGTLELKSALGLEKRLFEESIGNMKLEPYLTASSRTPVIELMDQLTQKKSKEQVFLIYRTKEDIEAIQEEQQEKALSAALIREKALKKHSKNLKCAIRKVFRYSCPICHDLSLPSNTTAATTAVIPHDTRLPSSVELQVEHGTLNSASSVPTTIDVELESGLMGMVTTTDIINQLTFARYHLNIHRQDSGQLGHLEKK